eukprot:6583237-Pyramimonas_sp.AAC.1
MHQRLQGQLTKIRPTSAATSMRRNTGSLTSVPRQGLLGRPGERRARPRHRQELVHPQHRQQLRVLRANLPTCSYLGSVP